MSEEQPPTSSGPQPGVDARYEWAFQNAASLVQALLPMMEALRSTQFERDAIYAQFHGLVHASNEQATALADANERLQRVRALIDRAENRVIPAADVKLAIDGPPPSHDEEPTP